MWLLIKSVNAPILADVAFFSAESVAHIFNKRRPNDKRIKKCINKMKMVRKGKVGFKTLCKYADSAKEAANEACNDYDEASFRAAISVYSAAYAALAVSNVAKGYYDIANGELTVSSLAWEALLKSEKAFFSGWETKDRIKGMRLNLLKYLKSTLKQEDLDRAHI